MFYAKLISITDRQFFKQIPFYKKVKNPLFKKAARSVPLSIKTFLGRGASMSVFDFKILLKTIF